MNRKDLFVWDGINCTLEEVDSIEDAKKFIRENCIVDGDIHPDIESMFIVQKVASVRVEETTEKKELNGEMVPVCKVIIE